MRKKQFVIPVVSREIYFCNSRVCHQNGLIIGRKLELLKPKIYLVCSLASEISEVYLQ